MDNGKPEQAYQLYQQLLEQNPGHNALLHRRAKAAVATGRYTEASADYRLLVDNFPAEAQLRQEAAWAEDRLGNKNRVNELLSPLVDPRVMAYTARTTPAHAATGGSSGRRDSLTQFSGRIRAGILYDSNANQGPASDFFSLGAFDLYVPGSKKTGTVGAYAAGNFNLLHRFGESSRLAFVADAGFFVRGNENDDLKEFKSREWQWGRAAAGLRYAADRHLFELRLKGEIFDYELTNNVVAFGPEVTYIFAPTERVHLITQGSADWRSYKRTHDRNGLYGRVSQYFRLFSHDRRHSFTLGGGYVGGDADYRNYSYDGFDLSARLALGVTKKFEVSPHVGFRYEQYKGPATFFELKKRRDERFRTGLDLVYRLNNSWSLEAGYQYVDNSSKSPLYEYKQHVVNVGVAWGF